MRADDVEVRRRVGDPLTVEFLEVSGFRDRAGRHRRRSPERLRRGRRTDERDERAIRHEAPVLDAHELYALRLVVHDEAAARAGWPRRQAGDPADALRIILDLTDQQLGREIRRADRLKRGQLSLLPWQAANFQPFGRPRTAASLARDCNFARWAGRTQCWTCRSR